VGKCRGGRVGQNGHKAAACPNTNDLLQALFRWIHFVAGITWIGMLYFFNLINAHVTNELQPPMRREVVPQMPRALWWFRWGAMFTFLFGLNDRNLLFGSRRE
jgi:uncharacterized membrane protein